MTSGSLSLPVLCSKTRNADSWVVDSLFSKISANAAAIELGDTSTGDGEARSFSKGAIDIWEGAGTCSEVADMTTLYRACPTSCPQSCKDLERIVLYDSKKAGGLEP